MHVAAGSIIALSREVEILAKTSHSEGSLDSFLVDKYAIRAENGQTRLPRALVIHIHCLLWLSRLDHSLRAHDDTLNVTVLSEKAFALQ